VTLPHGTPIEGVHDAVRATCSKVSLEGLVFDEVTHITFEAEASHSLDIVKLTDRIRAAGATKVV
jgi:hypothetical protein